MIMSVNLGQIHGNLKSAAICNRLKTLCSQGLSAKPQIDGKSGRQSRNLRKNIFFQCLNQILRFTENPPLSYGRESLLWAALSSPVRRVFAFTLTGGHP